MQELAELVKASFYLSTWILKLLLKVLKPPLFGSNSTSLTSITPLSTAPPSIAPASVIATSIANNGTSKTDVSINPYKLNKLNAGKPGFTKDRKIIIRYKFKYFKKGNKKG